MKKLFLSALMCVMAISASAQYVDLGLPSGTKWKATNESGFYTYLQAKANFGNSIPSKTQWEELIDYCSWEWTGRGYKVVGPNNRSIFLPADGLFYYNHNEYDGVGTWGIYYAFSSNEEHGWVLSFEESRSPQMGHTDDFHKKAFSTRLVE